MAISDKLLELRKKRKMTQKELAEKLYVTDKVISRWETGRALPDVEMMYSISKVLDVSISELYDQIELVKYKNDEDDLNVKIWNFKKYSIISYILLVLSPALLLFINFFGILNGDNSDTAINILNIIFFVSAICFVVLAIVFETLQFIYFCNTYKRETTHLKYKKVVKIYGIVFLSLLIICIISNILIILI